MQREKKEENKKANYPLDEDIEKRSSSSFFFATKTKYKATCFFSLLLFFLFPLGERKKREREKKEYTNGKINIPHCHVEQRQVNLILTK